MRDNPFAWKMVGAGKLFEDLGFIVSSSIKIDQTNLSVFVQTPFFRLAITQRMNFYALEEAIP